MTLNIDTRMKLLRVLNENNEWILTAEDAIDNYYIGSQIGAGQYGTIHRGYDKLTKGEVAIKRVPVEDGTKLEEAQYEVIVLKHLAKNLIEHPNLLNYKAAFLQEDQRVQDSVHHHGVSTRSNLIRYLC